MITQEQLLHIGKIQRLHGLKGEFTVRFDDVLPDDTLPAPCLFIARDALFVPFFLTSCRIRNGQALLSIEGVTTPAAAETFLGSDLYVERSRMPEPWVEAWEGDEADDDPLFALIGYTLADQTQGTVGEIIDIDDATENVLFIVDRAGEELLVPAADDLVVEIDDEQRRIVMQLPDGLLDDTAVETV